MKNHFGLGLFLGEPTGVSGKYFFSEVLAADVGVSYSFDNYFLGWAGALYHFPNLMSELEDDIEGKFLSYIGVGAGAGYSTKDSRDDKGLFFVRIPLGLEWVARGVPIGVFIEIDPGISLVPDIDGAIFGGIGARWYF